MKTLMRTIAIAALGLFAAANAAATSISGIYVLAQNEDWRTAMPMIASGAMIDLNGHDLTISQFAGDYEITDSTDSPGGGKLHVNCTEAVNNTTVTLSGSLRLVKEGTGKLTMAKKGQTYSGGTEIVGGTLTTPAFVKNGYAQPEGTAKDQYLGAQGTEIKVGEEAELNIAGNFNYSVYHVILDGGTLRNTDSNGGSTAQAEDGTGLGWLTLTKDSTFHPRSNTVFSGKDDTPVDLGGCTLTVSATGYYEKQIFWKKNVVNGTLKFTGENKPTDVFKTSSVITAADVSLIDDMGLNMANAMSVSNYTSRMVNDHKFCTGSAALNVSGTFRPETRYFYGCTLLNGATLDLSAQEGAWNTTSDSKYANYTSKTVRFADGAAIKIDVGDRQLQAGEQVISWSAKPANVNTLSFVITGNGIRDDKMPEVTNTGVFYYAYDPDEIRWAHWTGAGHDDNVANPENWVCTNLVGEAAQGRLPGEKASVYLSGNLALKFGETFNVYEVFLQDVTLADACDWSKIKAPLHGRIDLRGHNLTVSQLVGDCEITDSTGAPDGGELHVNCTEAVNNVAITLSGSLRLVKEGEGEFTATKTGQTYTGGTVVSNGTFHLYNDSTRYAANKCLLGARNSTVTVAQGGKLNISGTTGLRFYDFVLAGGTLANENFNGNAYMLESNQDGFGKVTLTADSTLLAPRQFVFNKGVLDLGGHTLTMDLGNAGSKNIYLLGSFDDDKVQTITNGTIRVVGRVKSEYARLTCCSGSGGRVDARTVTLDMVSAAQLYFDNTDLYVQDYISEVELSTSKADNVGTHNLYVSGTFKPCTKFFYGCCMQDGSTIDLSSQSGAWDTTSTGDCSRKTVSFDANATVTVDIGTRDLKSGTKIVSWSQTPTGVKFSAPKGASYCVSRAADGLYYTKGLTVIVH